MHQFLLEVRAQLGAASIRITALGLLVLAIEVRPHEEISRLTTNLIVMLNVYTVFQLQVGRGVALFVLTFQGIEDRTVQNLFKVPCVP